MENNALENFLRQIVDYAGLFPPSGLNMEDAAAHYSRYRHSPENWILGRFVVPFAKLHDLRLCASQTDTNPPWQVSALVTAPAQDPQLFSQAIEEISRFNQSQLELHVDSLETKVDSIDHANQVAHFVDNRFRTFWEIACDDQMDSKIAWVKSLGKNHAAKIRTGGIESTMIPSPEKVALFIDACARQGVAFKATAGLHHPIRNEYRLTYEPNSACAVMFGFLNVFVAALLAKTHRLDPPQIAVVLNSQNVRDFSFEPNRFGWGMWYIDADTIGELRESFAVSFGSCSFEEPVTELRQLGFLSTESVV